MTARFHAPLFDAVLPRFAPRDGARITLSDLFSLARQRRALAALDDHLLDDLALTRRDAMQEAARPVWDVPATWRN